MKITVGIPTKNRYDLLPLCLMSMATQTLKPYEIILIDDSEPAIDIRTLPVYQYIMVLLERKGIKFRFEWGIKQGNHHSHQRIQDLAETEWIFRIDDDEIAEPECLERLSSYASTKQGQQANIGAIGPLVMTPNAPKEKKHLDNKITDVYQPAAQWFEHDFWFGNHEHLHSCFLYKKGIAKQVAALSPVSHREETLFTYAIKKAGYELLIEPAAVVWHFQSPTGGIRSYNNPAMYDHDESIFNSMLSMAGVAKDEETKYVVLDCGIGDHYAFKNILPELRAKYKKIVIASAFAGVFWDEIPDGIEIISIADAHVRIRGIDRYNIYGFMASRNWNKNLVEAFKEFYL